MNIDHEKHLQLKHKGVKYACNQCDKKFTQQITLTRHIHSIHEGIKYPCDQCGKQYTEEAGLRKHIKSKHKRFKYTCNQCAHYRAADTTSGAADEPHFARDSDVHQY